MAPHHRDAIPEKAIDEYVRRFLDERGQGAHNYSHTRRVYALALEIGRRTHANLRVVGAAALLHDIGRPREKETGISHAILSGEMAREILSRVGYSDNEIEQVVGAIRTHRYSEGLEPESLEGQVLSDADRLDAIGAIGIFRAIAQASSAGTHMDGFLGHAEEKLLRLRDLMYTGPARALAEERHALLEDFVNGLRLELENSRTNCA